MTPPLGTRGPALAAILPLSVRPCCTRFSNTQEGPNRCRSGRGKGLVGWEKGFRLREGFQFSQVELLETIFSITPRGADGRSAGGGSEHKGGGGKPYKPKFGDGPVHRATRGQLYNYPGSSCIPNCVAMQKTWVIVGDCFKQFATTFIITNKSTIMQAVREMREEHIKDG